MPLIVRKWIIRADLRADPEATHVFGDNERRFGLGGQAREMRGEPNAVGVATLQAPGVFWSEADADRQCAVIDADMAPLFQAMRDGKVVVFPIDGIGTGLADLANKSPTTFAHLQRQVAALTKTEEQF